MAIIREDLEAKKRVEIRRKLRLAGFSSTYITNLNQEELEELYDIVILSQTDNYPD